MKKFILIIIPFLSLNLFAADRYSIKDGMGMTGTWNDGNYWSASSGGSSCGCTPGTKDVIFIYQNMGLTQDFSMQATTGRLEIAAGKSLYTTTKSLSVNANTTLYVYGTLEVYDLVFDNGSVIYVAPGGVIIVHHNFTNRNNSDDVTINGAVTVTGIFDNGNGGIVAGSGSITASDYNGAGTTFGHTPTSSIPNGVTVTSAPLPVELISFTASSVENKVELNWQTLTEVNNKWFEVEKSADAVSFSQIGIVNGSGNTNSLSTYNFTDESELAGLVYYRLKQVDFDGKYEYTEIISINISSKTEYSIYPNPANAYQDIYINGNLEQPVQVEIYDIQSKLVYQTISSGIIQINNNTQITPGMYFVKILNGSESTTTRVIIN